MKTAKGVEIIRCATKVYLADSIKE